MSISRFDHPAGEVHVDPAEERSGRFSVSFVESGRFDLVVGRNRHTLDGGRLFVTRPGLAFHCVHQSELPDDVCTSVELAPAFGEEVSAAAEGGDRHAPPVVPMTNRLGFLRLALMDAARTDGVLAAETLAGELLAAALGPGSPSRLFRAGQLAWYARRVRSSRERIEADPGDRHTLGDLARDAGMSPYHFARVFGELAGMPPHRYLRAVRLRRAAALIAEGASVTEACFRSGFRNLGHFSRSFRRAFGVPPSRYGGSLRGTAGRISGPSRGASRG